MAWAAIALCGSATAQEDQKPAREFFELRIYQIYDIENQQRVEAYLQQALLPALGRLGLERIGVFTVAEDPNDHSLFVVIPFPDIETFAGLNDSLAADAAYQQAARDYFDRPLKEPAFQRIESRFLKAFAGMPVLQPPPQSRDKQPRIFELRLYQSHTEDHAARKVAMFNEGEIQIMREARMGPVFFGETLIGPDAPNLVYMLSADDLPSHQEHWKAFLAHPDWERMKSMDRYKDTVSAIKKWFLEPTAYSQL